MARLVSEIMNSEVFHLRPDDEIDHALRYLEGLGISGAPVMDRSGELVGVVSLKDLIKRGGARVSERMSHPAVSVGPRDSIQLAAALVAEGGYRRLPVVDEQGALVGVVSALDLLRGLLGVPVTHPDAFPHYDRETGLNWTDDRRLELDQLDTAPDGPGILMLRVGGKGASERALWSEPSRNVRQRLYELLQEPERHPMLQRLLQRHPGQLRFRVASLPDPAVRHRALSDAYALRPS